MWPFNNLQYYLVHTLLPEIASNTLKYRPTHPFLFGGGGGGCIFLLGLDMMEMYW